jgi:hypothetical protein
MMIRLLPLALGVAAIAAATTFAAAQSPAEYCQQNFSKLKAGLDKRGKAIEAANKRKANVVEACGLFKSYVAAEISMLNFMKKEKERCGVPDEVLKKFEKTHARSSSLRTKICKAASTGGQRSPSAGLSGALGLTELGHPSPGEDKGSGVFDTLTGNILK